MNNVADLEPCLILGCTIDPKGMKFLVRNSVELRLEDYKKSFNKWIACSHVKKLIFVENSGYDLTYFKEKTKSVINIEIEFLSTDENNFYPRELGKGFGESIILKNVIEKSNLFKQSNSFVHISGRHYIKNYGFFLAEFKENKTDIFLTLSNNLKFCEANIYGGSSEFLKDYVYPESKKVNDSKEVFFEHCVAKATLKAIANDLSYGVPTTYANIEGYIGTNGKPYKSNILKRIKLNYFGKLKKYFFQHKKY